MHTADPVATPPHPHTSPQAASAPIIGQRSADPSRPRQHVPLCTMIENTPPSTGGARRPTAAASTRIRATHFTAAAGIYTRRRLSGGVSRHCPATGERRRSMFRRETTRRCPELPCACRPGSGADRAPAERAPCVGSPPGRVGEDCISRPTAHQF